MHFSKIIRVDTENTKSQIFDIHVKVSLIRVMNVDWKEQSHYFNDVALINIISMDNIHSEVWKLATLGDPLWLLKDIINLSLSIYGMHQP